MKAASSTEARLGGTVRCAGSGTSIPKRDATTTCIVRIPRSKPSGLCAFCERTEKR